VWSLSSAIFQIAGQVSTTFLMESGLVGTFPDGNGLEIYHWS